MNETELRQAIANLPPTAATKPILDSLLTDLGDLRSNQERIIADIHGFKEVRLLSSAKDLSAPSHPMGLCQESNCAPCVAQGQELVALGRGAVQADIDQALEWYGGLVLQEKVAAIVGKWLSDGRPSPTSTPAGSEPYLVFTQE